MPSPSQSTNEKKTPPATKGIMQEATSAAEDKTKDKRAINPFIGNTDIDSVREVDEKANDKIGMEEKDDSIDEKNKQNEDQEETIEADAKGKEGGDLAKRNKAFPSATMKSPPIITTVKSPPPSTQQNSPNNSTTLKPPTPLQYNTHQCPPGVPPQQQNQVPPRVYLRPDSFPPIFPIHQRPPLSDKSKQRLRRGILARISAFIILVRQENLGRPNESWWLIQDAEKLDLPNNFDKFDQQKEEEKAEVTRKKEEEGRKKEDEQNTDLEQGEEKAERELQKRKRKRGATKNHMQEYKRKKEREAKEWAEKGVLVVKNKKQAEEWRKKGITAVVTSVVDPRWKKEKYPKQTDNTTTQGTECENLEMTSSCASPLKRCRAPITFWEQIGYTLDDMMLAFSTNTKNKRENKMWAQNLFKIPIIYNGLRVEQHRSAIFVTVTPGTWIEELHPDREVIEEEEHDMILPRDDKILFCGWDRIMSDELLYNISIMGFAIEADGENAEISIEECGEYSEFEQEREKTAVAILQRKRRPKKKPKKKQPDKDEAPPPSDEYVWV